MLSYLGKGSIGGSENVAWLHYVVTDSRWERVRLDNFFSVTTCYSLKDYQKVLPSKFSA